MTGRLLTTRELAEYLSLQAAKALTRAQMVERMERILDDLRFMDQNPYYPTGGPLVKKLTRSRLELELTGLQIDQEQARDDAS